MRIEILGPGCARCKTLAENVRTALEKSGLTAEIVKVIDINEIASRGVLMTPALVIDGSVITAGKVSSVEEIRDLFESLPDALSG
jgi:small redox-active disulfide protein 2